jgi:hypothetical protein
MDARANARPLKLAIAIALLCAAAATPCSFDTEPRLFYDIRPDAPIDRYAGGDLGILQPDYARSHLVIAFRHLSGKPPSDAEREGFLDVLQERLNEYPDEHVNAAAEWERLRTTVRGVAFQNAPDQTRVIASEDYEWFDNCTDDAFRTATATLNARIATFGAKSEAVTAWLDAQEIVFGNCSDGAAHVPDAPASLPEIIRADRQYQMAAADFYALRYGEARERFLRIAADKKSPWRATSRLVAARALIRADSLDVLVDEENPLEKAQQELDAIASDKSMAAFHDNAWALNAYAVARNDAQGRFDDAAEGLRNGEPSAKRARVDLADYTFLWEKEGIKPGGDELTDWINTFKDGGTEHAVERWNATKGMHWLVAALTHAKPGDAWTAKLLRDSASVPPDSPAFVSVTYHRVRLLTDADARRAELDRVLARDIPRSARNQLLEQRRSLARSLAEFLRDTPVAIVGEGMDPVTTEEKFMPPDATFAFNIHMPLSMLQQAAKDESLDADVRARLARAVELRAALLAKPNFDLAYAMSTNIGADPYVYPFRAADERPNWWCQGGQRGDAPPVPPFLDGQLAAEAEEAKLTALGSGASWILRTTLARAKSHPDDPRVPEALASAIENTRWACGDADTDALAEQAFGVLKRKYAKTEWAQQTKYWYRAAY